MALIICKECNKNISEHAKFCPYCGFPIQENKKEILLVSTTFTRFITIYIIAMIPTYFLRYLDIFTALQGINTIDHSTNHGYTSFFFLLLCYIIMIGISYSRGKSINKPSLAAFPIISAIFDIILFFIPFIPTILNILTIVLLRPTGEEKPYTNSVINKLGDKATREKNKSDWDNS